MPLSLSADVLSQITTAAQAIAPDRREAFLQMVANTLTACSVIGPGVVHRAIVAAQREYFDPPLDTGHPPLQMRKVAR